MNSGEKKDLALSIVMLPLYPIFCVYIAAIFTAIVIRHFYKNRHHEKQTV